MTLMLKGVQLFSFSGKNIYADELSVNLFYKNVNSTCVDVYLFF